jgi:hypothetical protein
VTFRTKPRTLSSREATPGGAHRAPSRLSLGLALPAATLLTAALGASPGCSYVVHDLTDRCSNDADCTSRGAEYENATCVQGLCRQGNAPPGPPPDDGSPWGCLASLDYKPALAPQANINFRFVDPVGDVPLPGIEVRSCSSIDGTCIAPLAGPVTSDADGRTQLSFSTENAASGGSANIPGFLGYFYLTGGGRAPHLFSVHPPMVADREASFRVVSQEQIDLFASIAGIQPEPERSLLIIQSRDCQNVPTPRSTIAVIGADDKTKLLYLSGGLPSLTATETDSSGTVFVSNTVPGIVTIEIVNLDAGRRVARTSVTVRRDNVTYAEVGPLPDR